MTTTLPDQPLFSPQEVAQLVGIRSSRLPAWEEALTGFLSPLTRPRLYPRADVETLLLAQRWRQEGSSIADIRARLSSRAEADTAHPPEPCIEHAHEHGIEPSPSPTAQNTPAPTPAPSPTNHRPPSGPHWRAHPTFSLDPSHAPSSPPP